MLDNRVFNGQLKLSHCCCSFTWEKYREEDNGRLNCYLKMLYISLQKSEQKKNIYFMEHLWNTCIRFLFNFITVMNLNLKAVNLYHYQRFFFFKDCEYAYLIVKVNLYLKELYFTCTYITYIPLNIYLIQIPIYI